MHSAFAFEEYHAVNAIENLSFFLNDSSFSFSSITHMPPWLIYIFQIRLLLTHQDFAKITYGTSGDLQVVGAFWRDFGFVYVVFPFYTLLSHDIEGESSNHPRL